MSIALQVLWIGASVSYCIDWTCVVHLWCFQRNFKKCGKSFLDLWRLDNPFQGADYSVKWGFTWKSSHNSGAFQSRLNSWFAGLKCEMREWETCCNNSIWYVKVVIWQLHVGEVYSKFLCGTLRLLPFLCTKPLNIDHLQNDVTPHRRSHDLMSR